MSHVITPNSSSVDDLALLLVELTEGQSSRDLTLPLPSQEFSSEVCTPNVSTAGNICDERRAECDAPTDGHLGMGTCNERVFRDGLQVVVNLSSRVLTPAEISLLSKGLSFCPTPKEVDIFALKKDMFDFVRRLRLKEYFCGKESIDGDFSDQPAFRKRSTWCPERNRDAILETYVSVLEKKILSQDFNIRCHRNLSKDEQEALENLRRYEDIIIKPADKGSAVVVMDRARYVGEAMRQLSDKDVYLPLSNDPTAEMVDRINERVRRLHSDGYISDSTLQFLLINCNARAGRFYLLPKIHKENSPGRPVISGCNTPTEKISAFVDHQLKHLVPQIPSYVKDTNDFLAKLKDMERFPDGAILVTLDVVGLYPNIPHDEGLEALRRTLNERSNPVIPTDHIVDLAELVLKNNNFEFEGSHFLQKRGTAIGTRMAPAYANLFMHHLESQLLNLAPVKPYLWLRYIDDIFMIWTAGEQSLLEFLQWINQLHDNIKFTWDWSKRTINYLDVQIINNNGVIETDLYTKPTDKHQYLFHTSCHPKGVKQSIPYAQALRLRRICSTSAAFENRAAALQKHLVHRGYREPFVRGQIHRARMLDRNELFVPKQGTTRKRVPFVVTYHPGLPNIGGILKELHPLLSLSNRCKQAIHDLPMMAFRRPKSLKDYLVHAKLRPLDQDFLVTRGTHKCGSSRCDVCNYLIVGDRFSSLTTGTSYTINRGFDCNSRNVVYLINCKVCGFQYVGSTTTKFRLRFNNHKSRLRAHSRMLAVDKESDDLVYRHFYSLGHHGLSDVRIQLIDKVNDKDDLLAKEGQWVYRLRSLKPDGLNESDFFFGHNRGERGRK